jgi:hypothetical protein
LQNRSPRLIKRCCSRRFAVLNRDYDQGCGSARAMSPSQHCSDAIGRWSSSSVRPRRLESAMLLRDYSHTDPDYWTSIALSCHVTIVRVRKKYQSRLPNRLTVSNCIASAVVLEECRLMIKLAGSVSPSRAPSLLRTRCIAQGH